jgi:hypothetical protein
VLIGINRKVNKMATQADLDAALDALMTAVKAAADRVSADIAALQAKIDSGATGPDLQPEIDKVNAGVAAISAIDPSAPAPTLTP